MRGKSTGFISEYNSQIQQFISENLLPDEIEKIVSSKKINEKRQYA